MTPRTRTHRRRAAPLALLASLAVASFGAPAGSSVAGPARPAQESDGAQLKAEYDEVIGQEVELLKAVSEAQTARREASDRLRVLQSQTETKQLELLGAQQALTEAEALVERRIAARERAERKVEAAQDRLREQIVAAYVTGGDSPGLVEALLNAEDGEQVGQALAYGRAVSDNTATLVDELEAAEAEQAEAAAAARRARAEAQRSRDAIEDAARFLVAAREEQREVLAELDAQVLVEIDALRQVQGRKALVEGRITAMSRASDGVAQILAEIQADQPDWKPGVIEITPPLPGVRVSSEFGQRAHPILGITRLHAGADLGAPTGTPVYAPADGVVVLAEVRGGYGNTVVIDHGNSLGTLYAHNSELLVTPGQLVQRGDVIAKVGSTGLSTGPHVHFETRIKGQPIDPEGVIDFSQDVDYEQVVREREERERQEREDAITGGN